MARVLSFVEFGRRCPSSPDYSPLTVAPSPRAASPEYTPVSLLWRAGTLEHAPSTALRLGPPVPPPPLRRRVPRLLANELPVAPSLAGVHAAGPLRLVGGVTGPRAVVHLDGEPRRVPGLRAVVDTDDVPRGVT
ncbi:DNA-directed RNA polymerase II subunit RPB1-like [Panicum miliaceum]|uniref:DNA-directed RNA polymerase II subunit RPB1-like n=1 Tax=Panicum miliaceum TaxID=4540 RepID=A0A3L6SEH8_PANMI|nr:DNA-directed RNA polymerase II subunit RPB1-like [Panicum miliaceum]